MLRPNGLWNFIPGNNSNVSSGGIRSFGVTQVPPKTPGSSCPQPGLAAMRPLQPLAPPAVFMVMHHCTSPCIITCITALLCIITIHHHHASLCIVVHHHHVSAIIITVNHCESLCITMHHHRAPSPCREHCWQEWAGRWLQAGSSSSGDVCVVTNLGYSKATRRHVSGSHFTGHCSH